ncbi:MAG: hypothetical protein GX954_08215, partial [Clostridium cochlearium]|nr:hypothetical protein [Clostridium cochlearium]
MKNIKEVVLTGNDLTLEELVLVAREGYKVSLSEEAKKNVLESRKIIDDIV